MPHTKKPSKPKKKRKKKKKGVRKTRKKKKKDDVLITTSRLEHLRKTDAISLIRLAESSGGERVSLRRDAWDRICRVLRNPARNAHEDRITEAVNYAFETYCPGRWSRLGPEEAGASVLLGRDK